MLFRNYENLRTDQHGSAGEYITRTELEEIQRDFETIITQNSSEIGMDFTQVTDSIKGEVAINQQLLEEYIRFRGR